MRRSIVAIAVVLGLALTGCGNKSASPSASESDVVISESVDPAVSYAPNDIDKDAATAYRDALNKSVESAKANGLTELWSDETGALETVLAWDAAKNIAVQSDLINEDTEEIDLEGLMPQSLLDELDSLESNAGDDFGSVKSTGKGVFVITNFIEDINYVTTYEVDSQGRIAKATSMADGEAAGTAVFEYTVTKEGKAALAAVAE